MQGTDGTPASAAAGARRGAGRTAYLLLLLASRTSLAQPPKPPPQGGGTGSAPNPQAGAILPAVVPNTSTDIFTMLGNTTCVGDDLWRPMSSLCTVMVNGVYAGEDKSPDCAAFCSKAAAGMSRCMGFEARADGTCCLFDRDWNADEVSAASKLLGITLDSQGLQEFFPGVHLVRVQDSSTYHIPGTYCYRRSPVCTSAPNCAALNRYPCERGKVANTCDVCLPRYKPSQRACADTDQQARDALGASCQNYTASDCGRNDDADFNSSSMCCACGGGSSASTGQMCRDTDGDSTDSLGRPCAAYAAAWCGLYDTSTFRSAAMCCLCGGGSAAGNSTCVRDEGAPVPTLRIGFPTSTYATDKQDKNEGLQACYLGVALAVKKAWEEGADIIPIPQRERENFTVEFIGFTENYTKVTDRSAGGTQEADPTSLLTGLMAMNGLFDPVLSKRLQLRESSPRGQPAHAILGNLASLELEVTLVQAGAVRQTPVIGFRWGDPPLENRPYYVRSNRVAAKPGRAIGKILKELHYTVIWVFEQVVQPVLGSQILEVLSTAKLATEAPAAQTSRGPCFNVGCAIDIKAAWARLRKQDARIIVHEHGGGVIEQLLALPAGLLGPKTLYVKSGPYPCQRLPLMDAVSAAQVGFQLLPLLSDVLGQADCDICPNVAAQNLPPSSRDNRTFTIEWLNSSAFASQHRKACPRLPNASALWACSYCDTMQSYFATPGCAVLEQAFDDAYDQSMCVGGDDPRDTEVRQAWVDYFAGLGGNQTNSAANGQEVARLLRAAGMPASYLQSFEPGGRLWDLGLQSSKKRPVTWMGMWQDVDLVNTLGKVPFQAAACTDLTDALLILLAGYNAFLKLGGDSDASSQASQPWTHNYAAGGFLQSLLLVNFTGFSGPVNFGTTGDRVVLYNVYQQVSASTAGCFAEARFDLSRATGAPDPALWGPRRLRFVAPSWNFEYAAARTNLTGGLVAVLDGAAGCQPLAPSSLAGQVAFIKRGGCMPEVKLLHVAGAGAVAAVIWNQLSDAPDYMEASDPLLQIPGVSIGYADGAVLMGALALRIGVNLTVLGSTRCVDPKFSRTGGQRFSERTLVYDAQRDALVGSLQSIRFNGGGGPPLQAPPTTCRDGTTYNFTLRDCILCRPGTRGNSGVCISCDPGRFANASGSTSCDACDPGRVAVPTADGCAPCPRGSVSNSAGACSPCDAGRYWNENASALGGCQACAPGRAQGLPGSTECRTCEAGRFANEWGRTACSTCQSGSYLPEEGRTACLLCNATSYQPVEGSAECLPCSDIIPGSVAPGMGTDRAAFCHCRAGDYLLRAAPNDTGACAPCPEGLTCPGGLDAQGACCEPPTQNANMHAGEPPFPHGPIPFMIRCANSKRCPAGRPLGVCPPHAQSRACDLCEPGWTPSRNGHCTSCEERTSFLPLFFTLLAFLAAAVVLALYAVREVSVQSQTLMTVGITFTLVASCLQVLSAFSGLSLDWPEPMQSLYFALQVVALRIQLLSPSCVFGTNAPQWEYLGTLLVHPVFAVALGIVFLILRLLPARFRRVAPATHVANAQGLVLLMMYVSISLVAVLPWQCERNLDGTFSVVTHRNVQCWAEGPHRVMLACSFVGIFAYDVSFLAIVMWATYAYPIMTTRPGGAEFLQGFHFLFNRFKPHCYYYGLLYCLRNLVVALIPVVFVNEVVAQLMLMGLTVMVTAVVQSWVQPWRSKLANYLDGVAWTALMVILLGGAMILEHDSATRRRPLQVFFNAALYTTGACFALTLLICAALMVWPHKRYGAFLSHHKVGAAVLARWFKIILSPLTNDTVFYDSDNLNDLDTLFQVCAHESKNIVVLLTRETLRRIWCAGEITSATMNKVNLVFVSCNDFTLPTPGFISNLGCQWPEADVARVAQLGVQLEDIQRCYMELHTKPLITLDRTASIADHSKVVHEVFSRCTSLRKTVRARLGDAVATTPSSATVTTTPSAASGVQPLKTLEQEQIALVLLGCAKEPEDRLVAAVVAVMLQEETGSAVDLVEEPRNVAVPDTGCIVVLLARGILEDARVGAALGRHTETALIPIHFDACFSFPTAEWYASLLAGKVIKLDDLGLGGVSLEAVAAAYSRLFSVLSLRFSPHASEVLQRAEVSEMVPRVCRIVHVGSLREKSLQISSHKSTNGAADHGSSSSSNGRGRGRRARPPRGGLVLCLASQAGEMIRQL